MTGHIYTPRGQAIRATHFHVDRMRFVTPRRGFGAILELWPELELRGKFRTREGEVGSKSEGSTETSFVDDGGTSYMLQGAETKLPEPGKPVWIKARGCVPDYSFVATTTSDRAKLWILEVRDHEHVRE